MAGEIAHASFGASNSKRRMACPGSLKAEERFPDESSPFAELGTAAHELGEHCLENNIEDVALCIGGSFNDHIVDDNMATAVQTYVNFVRATEAEEAPALLRLEQRFSLEDLDPPMPMFGTSDCTIYGKETGNLWIIDYKHGQGVAVDVEDNAQLKYYALGAVLKIGNKAPINQVHTAIVQPRASHRDGSIRTYSYTKDEILDFGTDLIDAAHAALAPDAPLIAGDHCKFCKAAGVCSALRGNALAVAQDEFGVIKSVDDLTPEEIGAYMDKLPLVEEWIKSLRRHAHTMLEAGTSVPGFKLVEKRPTRRWKNQEELLDWAASENLEDEEIFEKKIKSPAQIEKVVGKKNVPSDLIMSVSTGLSMVPDTDRRPPAALLASDEFTVNE
ncbi:MAG: DUF2800 domain-containing protein [Pseudohongiellaceae bacterium]|jgi:hypothetical protein